MHRPDLAALSAVIENLLPKLNTQEQQVSLTLYRLLAEGKPVAVPQLASALNLRVRMIDELMNRWWGIYYDNEHRVIGFWGLTLHEMVHRFIVEGRALYTWCAWDTLFIPELLNRTARVESICRTTNAEIRLTVTPERVTDLDPPGTVLSFVTPDAAKVRENVIANFCHYVHFFSSIEAGMQWVSEHPGMFLLSIEEAHSLGRATNALRYQDRW